MAFVAALIDTAPSPAVLLFAAAYGTLQMGIILVNTAEDYPEDMNAGITTTIVALGLHRGISLAFSLAVLGSAGLLATIIVLFSQRVGGLVWIAALLPAIAACVYVVDSVWRLKRAISGESLEKSIMLVKKTAKKVPLWVTLVAWSSLGLALALFCMANEKF